MKKILTIFCLLLPVTSFAYDEVDVLHAQNLAYYGMIVGKSTPEQYELDNYILRQEALGTAMKLSRASWEIDPECDVHFWDVTNTYPNEWTCSMVKEALENERVSKANYYFRPHYWVTRAEALGMLLYPLCDADNTEEINKYNFGGDTNTWQRSLLAHAASLGVIREVQEFGPNKYATRAEVFRWADKIRKLGLTKGDCYSLLTIPYYFDYKGFDKVIRVDTHAEKMRYYQKGRKIGEFIISSGSASHQTPTGRFEVLTKSDLMLSRSAQLWMPNWMEFYGEGTYGIHALPTDAAGNPVRDESSLGRSANGGCVRLSQTDSQTLYDWAELGTKVLIRHNK